MDRAEAIKQLDGADVILLNREFKPFQQAILMAIAALREQEGKDANVLTNADRIRAMTDEELGEFLGEWTSDPKFWKCDGLGECLAWLKQPYGGADHGKTI